MNTPVVYVYTLPYLADLILMYWHIDQYNVTLITMAVDYDSVN